MLSHNIFPHFCYQAMSSRDDVALFLCRNSPTCLDVADASNASISIRQMMLLPTCRVNEVLKRHAAKVSQTEEKRANIQKEVCENCSKRAQDLQIELLQCSRCLAAYYCSKKCQISHWKRQHKKDCAQREKEGELLLGSPRQFPADYKLMSANKATGEARFRYGPPRDCKPNDKFWIKVQSNGISADVMIYDQSRFCLFYLPPGQAGHKALVEKVTEQKAFLGKKSYFKAKFNDKGDCIVFPHTSSALKW